MNTPLTFDSGDLEKASEMFDTASTTSQNGGASTADAPNNDFTRADMRVGLSAEVLTDLAKAGLTPADIAIREETCSSLLHKFGRRTAERLRRGPAYAILYPGSEYERTKFLDGCPEDLRQDLLKRKNARRNIWGCMAGARRPCTSRPV
jgi:hypothetical protein